MVGVTEQVTDLSLYFGQGCKAIINLSVYILPKANMAS